MKNKTKMLKAIVIALAVVIAGTAAAIPLIASASQESTEEVQETVPSDIEELSEEDVQLRIVAAESEANTKSSKSLAAAIVVGISAAAGALGMAFAIAKSVEGTARQPEASGKIQTMLMLCLVFIETAIIYALIVAILIIFVL